MAHGPLFSALRRSYNLARLANQSPQRSVADLVAARNARALSRRRFLSQCAATAALAAGTSLGGGCHLPRRQERGRTGPRVAIVGAGVAGLNAAYQLRRSGIRATVYEASARTGGRMFSSRDLLGPGLVTELGGEFIDSNHRDILNLARTFRLQLLDMNAPAEADLIPEAYFFDGRHYSEIEVIAAFQPLAARIDADLENLSDVIDYAHDGGATVLDRTTLADYFDQIGATGFIRKLLDVAYVTEYGLECGEQSALNFLFLIGTDVSGGSFEAFGESDERYKIVGGNQRITDELANRLDGQVELGHRLVAVEKAAAETRLEFGVAGQAQTKSVMADFVILTIPFTVLRDTELHFDMPEVKRRAIAELGYGANAKLFTGQSSRPWQQQRYAGNIFSDAGFQLAWDNSRLQGTREAGITLYSGGQAGWEVESGSAEDQVQRLLPGLEQAFPGVIAARHGAAQRFHWPTHPFTRGSYACYRPGQWTTIAGAEGLPLDNILFAGEHCSRDFQGFMNGGAETGRMAARNILAADSTHHRPRLIGAKSA